MTFHIPRAGVCHGFAGYFEAVLYADVGLSIHPERAAGDMLSWFPIFFPLAVCIYSSNTLVFHCLCVGILAFLGSSLPSCPL